MRHKVSTFFHKNIYIVLLICIELVVFYTNYQPQTYLVGWDTVMPEWNINLNFKRALFAIWQEYRGLGLMDGMAHSANLLHTFYISLLLLIAPHNAVRYIFILITHLIGSIAFFMLAKKYTRKNLAAFLGALFYMFNIGVIQMYSAPLEVFATHFSTLPLIAIVIHDLYNRSSKKKYFWLTIVSFLTTPQAFVPTVFIVYAIFIGFFISVYSFFTKKWKVGAMIGTILFITNAFWFLPYAYGAPYNSKVIPNSRINQFSSEEIFYQNKAYGNLANVLSLKGFMMSSVEYDTANQKLTFLLKDWRDYTQSKVYIITFIVIGLISLIGLIQCIVRKNWKSLPYIFSFMTTFFLLANNTPVLEQGNIFFRNSFPILGEAFRFPFTKCITLFAFCYSLFFSFGCEVVLLKLRKKIFRYTIASLIIISIFIISFPVFQGKFFSPLMKQKIPPDYQQTMQYFENVEKNQRIALLPTHTFWNWYTYDWNFRGSGFWWYGIKQPILMRSFDPWSMYNEQVFNELSYSFNTDNKDLLIRTVKKYDIDYFVLDEHTINVANSKPINMAAIKDFLNNSEIIDSQKTFGKITVYKIKSTSGTIQSLPYSIPKVGNTFLFNREDNIYANQGNYVSSTANQDAVYPFSTLSTEKLQSDNIFSIQQENNYTSITQKIDDFNSQNGILEMPSYFSSEGLIPIQIDVDRTSLLITLLYPEFIINGVKYTLPAQQFTVQLNDISSIKKIEMTDTGHIIPVGGRTFLLHPFLNTLKVFESTNSSQIVTIDTQNLPINPIEFSIPHQKINSVTVQIPNFEHPYNIKNIVKNNFYHLATVDKQKSNFVQQTPFAQATKFDNSIKLYAKNGGNASIRFSNDSLFHNAAYLVTVNAMYQQGLPLNFYIDNFIEKRPELDVKLSKNENINYFFLPRTQRFFRGYGFHVTAKTVGTEVAEGIVNDISVQPIPLDSLKNIRIYNPKTNYLQENAENLIFSHPNYYSYRTLLNNSENKYLYISQSFHPGWIAYKVDPNSVFQRISPILGGTQLKNHVKINNWANGWEVGDICKNESSCTISIIFWPQYLQFLGFGLLGSTLLLFVYPWLRHIVKHMKLSFWK